MHEAFYKFSSEPFRLSPDPKFRFPHRTYHKAMTYMRHALHRAEGFIIITGQPGIGKTTLINDLLQELRTDKVTVAKLVSTQLKADDLLRLMAYSFGLNPEGRDKADVLNQMEQFLEQQHEQGRRSLLIVDEAQDVPEDALEELRLLTNIQIDSHPLLQIFLVGQEELRDVVSAPSLVQLHQRVIAATHIESLDIGDTKAYIQHRLQKVGWSGDPAFSEEIYPMVHRFSNGIPRQINQICSRLLLHGTIEEKHKIGIQDLKTVIEELRREQLLPTGIQEVADTVFWPEDPVEETYEDTRPLQSFTTAPNQPLQAATGTITASRGRVDKKAATQTPFDIETDSLWIEPISPHDLTQEQPVPMPGPAQATGDDYFRPIQPDTTPLPGKEEGNRIPGRKRHHLNFTGIIVLLAGFLIALLYVSDSDMAILKGNELVSSLTTGIQKLRSSISPTKPDPTTVPGQTSRTATQTQESASEQDKQADLNKILETGGAPASGMAKRYGPVKNNESLYDVAKKLQPGSDISVEQMMLVLQRANPGAFIDNNINKLRVGVVLRVPGQNVSTGPAPDPQSLVAEQFVVEQVLIRNGLMVERLEDAILRVNISSDGLFDFDSARIKGSASPVLQKLAEVLHKYNRMVIQVVGHTDSTGPEDYNLYLSQLRANAVADYLINLGLPRSRVMSEGRGDRDTRLEQSPNDSPANKRRVEIYIRPVQDSRIKPGFMALRP